MVQNEELASLLAALQKPSALVELAVLALCLAAAWGLARLWRGPTKFGPDLKPACPSGL